jgi:hypothetical protein
VIGIRDGSADQTEIDDLIQQWEKLPEDFIRALRRAATSYRREIGAAHSALFYKLWAEAGKKPGQSTSTAIQNSPHAVPGRPWW